jgi:6-pyruvoyltetrahydropterin/6-carboxytetrahydropterin synthase
MRAETIFRKVLKFRPLRTNHIRLYITMYKIFKKFEFASAHQLEGHPKCGKLHGHNYTCEIRIESDLLTPQYGFVFDFGGFKEIANKYDHSGNIINISSENLAQNIADEVKEKMLKEFKVVPEGKITVRLWESDHSYAEFSRPL